MYILWILQLSHLFLQLVVDRRKGAFFSRENVAIVCLIIKLHVICYDDKLLSRERERGEEENVFDSVLDYEKHNTKI